MTGDLGSGRVKRWSLAGLGWALLVTGLVGCGGDEPPPEPPSSATGSPSPTPTDSPSASDTVGPETAEDFIRRWVEAATAMQNSGDSDDFSAMSASCEPCDGLIDTVEGYYAAGGYVETRGWTILSIENAGNREFLVKVRSAPTKYRESSNSPTESFPGGQDLYRLTLRFVRDTWKLADFIEVAV